MAEMTVISHLSLDAECLSKFKYALSSLYGRITTKIQKNCVTYIYYNNKCTKLFKHAY